MKIIIAGAYAIGTHLAKLLSRSNHDTILIDESEARLADISGDYDLMTYLASPASFKTLKETGAHGADLFIAVTPDQHLNMTSCMMAHSMGAKKTVARIDDNDFIDCAPNGHPEHAVIAVNPSNTVVDAKPPVHFNIRILHNRFRTWGNPVLFAKSVRGLEVAGNRVASPDGGTMKAQELYRLSGCSRVKIGNNR